MSTADSVVTRSPEILSGTPVFKGTRVPVKTLIDYLEAGDSLEVFLQDFPTVSREQAVPRSRSRRRRCFKMRVLLDECLPSRLKQAIPGHEVSTVSDAGWRGKSNGELLGLASGEFDVFVTIDKNLPAQQNLDSFSIGVVRRKQSLSGPRAVNPGIARGVAEYHTRRTCEAGWLTNA